MHAEVLFDGLVWSALAGNCALLAVIALRDVVRRLGGAQLAYASWSLVPLLTLVSMLPAPARGVPAVSAIVQAFDASAVVALSVSPPAGWHASAMAAWLAGAVAMAIRLALQQRAFRRSLGSLLQVDRVTRVAVAECDADLPAVVGVWRPQIVLPADFSARYDDRERALVLAHEQVHLARGDTRMNALAAALRCLYWFNPLLHYAVARFRLDQELACDTAVITRFPRACRAYAEVMLKVQLAAQRPLPSLHCSWRSSHPLKDRIATLKHPLPSHSRRIAGALLFAAFGFGAAFVTWAAQSTRPLAVAAAAGTLVDAQLQISIEGAPPTSARVVHPLGEPFAVESDAGGVSWQAEMVAHAAEGGAIELAMTIRRDRKIMAEQTIVVRQGEPASIESGVAGQPGAWRIDANLHLREAGWKPAPAAGVR